MEFTTVFSKSALENLRRLPKSIARRVLEKIEFFRKQTNPLFFAKKLKDPRYGTYRFRVGDYRVIFDVDLSGNIKILLILSIKHRKEIYKDV